MNLPLTLIACLVPAHAAPAQQGPVHQGPVHQGEAVAPVVPLPSDPSQKLDVLELKNGDELVGRITSELDGYVEIEIEDGATVGVSRAMVKNVRKQAVAVPLRAAVVRPDDAWFVLHDADGASVGWLHTSITTANDGTFAVNEEYEFVNGSRRYQITNQCSADPNGRGVRCYYRERVSQPKLRNRLVQPGAMARSGERVEDERIVEARILDGSQRLVVTHLDGRGRTERQLPWSKESTFPLLARTLARQAVTVIGPVSMFDPANEQLVVRRVDGTGARQILIDGVEKRVGEVAVTNAGGTSRENREWVDANLRTVRRELAGPALVAMPSSRSSARSAVGTTTIRSAIVAEADGRFGLWVPNPSWVSVDPLPPGHLTLQCAVHGAEVRLSLLDHLEPGTVIDTAADAVGNWFQLLYPQLQIDSRYATRIRGRGALRMSATDSRNVDRATIDVVPFEDRFLVLICRAPRAAWDELSPDFQFVRRTIELDAAGLNPQPTGPLSRDRGGRMRPPVGPVPAPTAAPRVGSSVASGAKGSELARPGGSRKLDPRPNVRIPK